MSTKLIVTDGDAPYFEKWLAERLATIRQPDWDDDTLNDLNEYIRTLVKRQPSTEEFMVECEDVLDGVPTASAFVHELLQAIRTKRYRSPSTKLPRPHGRLGRVSYSSVNIDLEPYRHEGFHPIMSQGHVTQGNDDYAQAQELGEERSRSKRRHRRRKDRSRSPGREDIAVQPAHQDYQRYYASSEDQPYYNMYGDNTMPLQNMLAAFFGNMSNLPLLQSFALPSGQEANGMNMEYLKQYQCVNFRDFGSCLLGTNCQYAHDYDALPPLLPGVAPQMLNPTANSWAPDVQKAKKGRPGTSSILVTNIPEANLREYDVKEYFRRFGIIHSVAVDETESIAVVTYSDNQSATRAIKSPEVIFNSRFVETRYFRGSVVRGQIRDSNEQSGRRGVRLTIDQANLDNRDPEQIAQEAERLRSLAANQAEFRQQQYAYNTHIQSLKQQLYEKGRMLDSRTPVNNEKLTVEEILLKKKHLEAELASLEAGRDVDLTTKVVQQSAHQLDNRPRQFAVQIPDEKNYNDVADIIEEAMQMLKAKPRLFRGMDGAVENEYGEMDTPSVIVVSYGYHWQAQRMFDILSPRLEGKAKAYWSRNKKDALEEGMRSSEQVAIDQQDQGHNEGAHYNDFDAPQDLDVAEDEDWHY